MSCVNNPISPSGALVATFSNTKITSLINSNNTSKMISKSNAMKYEKGGGGGGSGEGGDESNLKTKLVESSFNNNTKVNQENLLTNENIFRNNNDVMDSRVRFLIEFFAGAAGGAVSRTCTAPIDRLRTVFQVQSVDISKNELSVRKIWDFMIIEGKWQSLWRGKFFKITYFLLKYKYF
jgi:hypothetical protein